MPTQTKTWQNKVLSAAAADQHAGLYWYIEITAPGRRVFPAAHPGTAIPVIAVAPDPEQTRHYAHLLAELFRANNPPGWEFATALTSDEALRETGCTWYRFGEIDIVCPGNDGGLELPLIAPERRRRTHRRSNGVWYVFGVYGSI